MYNDVLHFFAARSFWDWVEIVGVLLVLLGVAGEVWIPQWKFPPLANKFSDEDGEDSPILAEYNTRKQTWQERKEKWEHWAGRLVVIGLAFELAAMPNQFKENGELHEKVSLTEANNLVLQTNVAAMRSNNLVLEKEIGTLHKENLELESFVFPPSVKDPSASAHAISGFPGTKVVLLVEANDMLLMNFREEIATTVKSAGWRIVGVGIRTNVLPGVRIAATEQARPAATALINELLRNGVFATEVGADLERSLTNDITITVGRRHPFPRFEQSLRRMWATNPPALK